MKNLFSYYFVTVMLIVFIGCNQAPEHNKNTTNKESPAIISEMIDKTVVQQDTTPAVKTIPEFVYYTTACDSIKLDGRIRTEVTSLKESYAAHIFSKNAQLRCGHHPESKTLANFPLNTKVEVTELIKIDTPEMVLSGIHCKTPERIDCDSTYQTRYNETLWYKIQTTEMSGYVQERDLAMVDTIPNLLIGHSSKDRYRELVFKSYDPRHPQIAIDSLYIRKDHRFRIDEITGRFALDSINRLLSYETYRQSCPGSTTIILMNLTKQGRLDTIGSYFHTGESSWYMKKELYVPIKASENQLKLIEIGSFFNPEHQYLEVKPDFNFPFSQLIATRYSSGEPKLDNNDDEIIGQDGEPIIDEKIGKMVYYRWTGSELEKIIININ